MATIDQATKVLVDATKQTQQQVQEIGKQVAEVKQKAAETAQTNQDTQTRLEGLAANSSSINAAVKGLEPADPGITVL